jgi:AcrR family transcriptional regulator
MCGMTVTGHRERKKQRTREQIVDAAFRLFAERGFAATTVADIAAAADIAPRTFFSYFPSKEEVVFFDFDGLFESLSAAIVGRPDGVSAIDALRDWVAHAMPPAHDESPEAVLRKRLCTDEPSLSAHQQHLLSKLEDILREGVARDLGEPPDGLRSRMVSAATVAAMASLEDATGTKAERMALVDDALVFVRGGVAALQSGVAGRET